MNTGRSSLKTFVQCSIMLRGTLSAVKSFIYQSSSDEIWRDSSVLSHTLDSLHLEPQQNKHGTLQQVRHTNTLKQTETADLTQPTHSLKHTGAHTQNHSHRYHCCEDRVWRHCNQVKGQCLCIYSDPS